MEVSPVEEAIDLLEKANANLESELLTAPAARKLLGAYSRAEKMAAFGVAVLARKLDKVSEVSRVTGTSLGKAKDTVATGKVLNDSYELSAALQQGDISLDQATEIARAEESVPGVAKELVAVAKEESFHVLKEKSRKAKLEAEQHRDLAGRQRAARCARSHQDELGMIHVHIALEPHVGPHRDARRGRGGSPGARSQVTILPRTVRGPSRRRLRRASIRLEQRPGSPARARGAGQLRGREARLERGETRRDLQDPRDRPRLTPNR